MGFSFDEVMERQGTNSLKWDDRRRFFEGEEVLPLWVADMDFACPPCVVEAIRKRAAHPIYGYPGTPHELYSAVIGWMKRRFQVEVERDWLATVPGVVPGLHLAIEAFTEPGDRVVIQTPVYHPFFSAVTNKGRQLVENPLLEQDGRYAMDFDDLRVKLDERTKLLILCSPHNPVGRVWSREELLTLAKICQEHDLIVISDEIHSDLVYERGAHIPFYSLSPEMAERSLTFVSASKTFNLAGLFSSVAIAQNRNIMNAFRKAMNKAGIEFINVFGIEAMTAAYQNGDEWLDELLVYLRGNAEYIQRYLRERLPRVQMHVPEAMYLGWLDFRSLHIPHAELKRLLIHEAGLGLSDGAGFGPGGTGFMRINFACPRVILVEAMERLERVLASYLEK